MIGLSTGLGGSDKNLPVTDWITAISTSISVIIAVLIAGYSFYITRRNEQKQTMLHVFQLLNDNGHRNARRRIYNIYLETEPDRIDKILSLMGVDVKNKDTNIRESMEIVKADFDQIGSLVYNKAISKKEFLKIYWHDVLKCWKVLYDDINHVRGIGNRDYMMNFERLKSDAEKFKDTSVEKMEMWKDIIIRPQIIGVKPIISNTDCIVKATFDIKIDENSIQDNVSLKNSSGDNIPGDVSWNAQTKAIIFQTAMSNVPDDMYTFTISKNIKDLKGSHMNEDYPRSFPIQQLGNYYYLF